MSSNELYKKLSSQSPQGSMRTLCVYLLVVAGAIAHHTARADASWQSHTLGRPVIWQQIVPITTAPVTPIRQLPNFKGEVVSLPTRQLANWIVHSGDNQGLPFMIVDKVQAQVFMFDAKGLLSGSTSALLGLAVGDDSAPDIGKRKLSTILPKERTTPAGRFVASLGRSLEGKEILWVDYEAAISLHRVVAGTKAERRAERLASPLITEKRISYGCINVSVAFFEDVVIQAFTGSSGIVYILPETRDIESSFSAYYDYQTKQ